MSASSSTAATVTSLCFYSSSRWPIQLASDGALTSAWRSGRARTRHSRRHDPRLCTPSLEVVSPGDAYSELHDKALTWFAAGTQLVLVADPRHAPSDALPLPCRRPG